MKKIIVVMGLVLFIVPCFAHAENCAVRVGGAPRIQIDLILRALQNYRSAELCNGRHEIRFEMDSTLSFNQRDINDLRDRGSDFQGTFVVQSYPEEPEVFISGLKLARTDTPEASAILKFQGGGNITLADSEISCSTNLGTGIEILADNAKVKSTAISNCSEGVKIVASNAFLGAENATAYNEDKNTLAANAIGIHQMSGIGNRWPYNSISGGRGIVVEGGTRPALQVGEGDIATLECEQTEGEATVSSCAMQFVSLPEAAGEVEVYKTDRPPPVELQGRDYIAQCNVGEGNTCAFDASNATSLISQIDCGSEKCNFTAIFTNESSSMYVNPFKLEKNISSILMPTSEGPTAGPGVTEEEEENADHELYVSGVEDSGGDARLESAGGGQGGSLKNLTSGIAKACAFTTPPGMEFKGAFEIWWWLLFILPAAFVLRRKV